MENASLSTKRVYGHWGIAPVEQCPLVNERARIFVSSNGGHLSDKAQLIRGGPIPLILYIN